MYYTNVQNLGNHILVRGIDNGKRVKQRISYKPTLYVNVKQKPNVPGVKWRSLQNHILEPILFDSIYAARDFIKSYKDVSNFTIYGQTNFLYAYIAENYGGKIEWNINDIVIGTIDIEVASENGFPEPAHANEVITAITLHIKDKTTSTFFVFGCGEYHNIKQDVCYIKCNDEKDLLFKFIETWKKLCPDIVTGWNIQKFDFPYLINRANRLFMEEEILHLSPWKKITEREVFDRGGVKKVQIYDICGVSIVDYIDLYKKFSPTPNQESYRLDHIASVEIGEKKVDYSEYNNLYTLYKNNYQKFIEYNICDVELVLRINAKLRLLELALTLAYNNKVNYEDVFSQVRMWDAIINNNLRKKGIIIPPKKETVKSTEYVGAYVKEPKPGMYKNVVSFDLDGLYPHLIMMYNLGPETLVDPTKLGDEFSIWFYSQNFSKESIDDFLCGKYNMSLLKKYSVSITPNGQVFKRDKQGFLAELMESMYRDRKNYKDQMIVAKQELENIEGEMMKRKIGIPT